MKLLPWLIFILWKDYEKCNATLNEILISVENQLSRFTLTEVLTWLRWCVHISHWEVILCSNKLQWIPQKHQKNWDMAAIQCELKRCGTVFLSSDAVLVVRQTGGRDWLLTMKDHRCRGNSYKAFNSFTNECMNLLINKLKCKVIHYLIFWWAIKRGIINEIYKLNMIHQ